MEQETVLLDQELVLKTCTCLVDAMEAYSNTGASDADEITYILNNCMRNIGLKLNDDNQNKLIDLLTKK